MCLPGDIPRDDLADDEQEEDPLKMANIGSTPVTSRRLRAQYSKWFRKMALQTPGKCRQAVRRKMRRSTKFLYSQGNHILLSSVRDVILKWAGLKGDQFIDVFASEQAHLFCTVCPRVTPGALGGHAGTHSAKKVCPLGSKKQAHLFPEHWDKKGRMSWPIIGVCRTPKGH